MTAYYNEFELYAAEWLRNLMKKGLIADGVVDTRSIIAVEPADLCDFDQCHFFAGIGGWSYALRLAGWPDDRPVWTGSCPCQPFSVAGKGKGQADERHLWPEFHRLISGCRPPVVFGEQVAAAVGKAWLDGVFTDLEGEGYACGAVVLPACAVDAPHRRDRLWFVADAQGFGSGTGLRQGGSVEDRDGPASGSGVDISPMAHPDQPLASEERQQRGRELGGAGGDQEPGLVEYAQSLGRREGRPEPELRSGRPAAASAGLSGGDVGHANGPRSAAWLPAAHGRHEGQPEVPDDRSDRRAGPWGECAWILGADGKARRVEPGIRLLAHGVPARVGKLRAYGNAIVPQVAAEVIAAWMECRP